MKTFFVTATGTDIGKTFVICALCRDYIKTGLKAQAIKPVVSGWSDKMSDTRLLLESMNVAYTQKNIEAISPWRLKKPLSPNIAAKIEGAIIDFDSVVDFCKDSITKSESDYFFVEAAGGIMTPITDEKTFLDLALALDLPLIIVTGTYLGSISHSLTAIDSAKFRGASISCLIVNESNCNDTRFLDIVETFGAFSNIPIHKILRDKKPEPILL